MEYTIATYQTASGRKPVKQFISDPHECTPIDAAKIRNELKLLGKYGHDRIRDNNEYKHIKSAKGLYELRVGNYRLFFSCCQENSFVFYHIYKKTNSSHQRQDREIDVAEKRMIEYQSSGKCR